MAVLRPHLALTVSDVQRAVPFYAALFGTEPEKVTPGYAKFSMTEPDECPVIPGKRYLDWDLPDPNGRPVEAVRATRDEIARRVEQLVPELGGRG
jgi:catechol 2,3-dioxygenase-like lactoylglutathione lyase family enzyme